MFLSVSMSSPCLSSVLTNANLTMYQNGVPDVLPQQPSVQPSINNLQNSNPAYSSNISGMRNSSCCCDTYFCIIIAVRFSLIVKNVNLFKIV